MASLLSNPPAAEAAKIRIAVDSPGGLRQNVYLTRPVGLPVDRPVVFVIHESGQGGSEARDLWHELAVENRFLLVVPDFTGRQFPDAGEHGLGDSIDAEGRARPVQDTYFAMIEPIFDDVRRRYGMKSQVYAMYGRGAGAGFVHRFLYFVPGARVSRAVAADADWYTMPIHDGAFPYGLAHSGIGAEQQAGALRSPLWILLSESASAPDDSGPVPAPGILAQGATRAQRARAFLEAARTAAGTAGITLAWQLASVPGPADPDGVQMARAAVPYLLGPEGAARARLQVASPSMIAP